MSVDPRVDELLSRWEDAGFVPSADALCAECPEVLPELQSRMSQLRRMNRRLLRLERSIEPPEIPGYEIVRLIGEGGMGVVWQAVQLGTRRTVALKIMSGWDSAPTRARERFRREVELASRLEHPNIARVYDGDVRHGIGYLAMEMIDGEPLDRFAVASRPDDTQVLELFIQICRAVHYAHQRGIIHRDLKPSNILIDMQRMPHVLDFGLAKDLAERDGVTLDNVVPGTPRYMSPEQAAGRTRDIDVRSDVFALGVILYELLLKQSPYGKDGDTASLMMKVREGQTIPPRRVKRLFNRDLEAILVKSLEPQIDQRYGSAEAMARDLSNYLSGLPVTARRRTNAYVAKKWLGRHRAGAAMAIVLTALFFGIAIYSYVQILRQRSRAQMHADIAQAVNKFVLERLLTATDPAIAQGTPPTLRELLDKAAKELDTAFKGHPLVEAGVRLTIGRTYLNLAVGEAAEFQLRRALKLRQEGLPSDDPDVLEATAELAFVLESTWQLKQAEELQRELLAQLRSAVGDDDPRVLTCLHRLGNVAAEQQLHEQSCELLRKAYEGRLRVLGAEDSDTIWSMSDLGAVLGRLNEWERAESLLQGALELRLKTQGATHIDTLNAEYNLASLYRRKGDIDRAEALLIKCIANREQIYGENHPAVSLPMQTLAGIRLEQGRNQEAFELASRSYALRGGDRSLETHGVMNCLSVMVRARVAEGKVEEAKALLAPCASLAEGAIEAKNARWVNAYVEALAAVGESVQSRLVAQRLWEDSKDNSALTTRVRGR